MFSKISFISLLLIGSAILTPGIAQLLQNEQSPFGMHGENSPPFDNSLLNVGAKTVRYSATLAAWDFIERTKGIYNWSQIDSLVSATYQNNITMMLTVRSFNRWDQGASNPAGNQKYPKDINAYTKFLKTMVERYDGDGINDASGSPVVKYFQIENEVDGNFWDDTPEKYAELLTISYKTIKEANPNAKVAIAGVSTPKGFYDFYISVLNALKEKSFDIFDMHWYEKAEEYKKINLIGGSYDFKTFLSDLNSKLTSYGYPGISLWMSETATYGGVNVVDQLGNLMPEQNEKVQAANLLKRYAYYIANGVDVVMWYKMIETHHTTGGVGRSNDYFENTGLINNPQNSDGLSHKKLAYYTYKKMVEKLEGSDWKNIATIQEQNGIYIYKFTKQGTPVWVAWNDSNITRTITISGISSNRVRTTEAVPKYESGKEVGDYTTAFQTDTLVVTNGTVALTLGQRPVFVEPFTVTSVEEESENIPQEFLLYQNYPNPFNPTTTIKFQVPSFRFVSLKIFDVLGREVATLVNGELNAGEHTVQFNAKHLPSGVYFYRLSAGSYSESKKMLITK